MTIDKVYDGGTQTTRRQYGMWQKSQENKPLSQDFTFCLNIDAKQINIGLM